MGQQASAQERLRLKHSPCPPLPFPEMEDYNDTEEREGYFVRLRKFQSLK